MAYPAEIRSKVVEYFNSLELPYESVGDLIWLVRDPSRGLSHVVVLAQEDLVVVRVRVMKIPEAQNAAFFEQLLRLNVEMLHGAYALEDDAVIWVDTLEFQTMDLEEIRASLDAAAECMVRHADRLSRYR